MKAGTKIPKSKLTIFLLLIYYPINTFSKENFSQGSANYNQPLERPYTLRYPITATLEKEYHRQTLSQQRLHFIHPRPCHSERDSSSVCEKFNSWTVAEDSGKSLDLIPVTGFEYRRLGENAGAGELGLLAMGGIGPLSFFSDIRLFSETHEDFKHRSYDREFLEKQTKSQSGGLEYSSYSRYRSNFSLDLSFGRLTAARDALHWGPGIFTNLSFHQDAIPFNYLEFRSALGPLQISTVYGQLAIDGGELFRLLSESRSLYAHRYELSATRNITLGVSEQLVYFEAEDPFAFVPVVPLYISKGNLLERANNGNISFDLAWRIPTGFRFYSEFLIDDLLAPTSLFSGEWGNKWGWMAGGQWAKKISRWDWGTVVEFSRLEPWVYTHYSPNTAQTANQRYPLGNQAGPNSQRIVLKNFVFQGSEIYLSSQLEWMWKGTSRGSNLNDSATLSDQRVINRFLDGNFTPKISWTPRFVYTWRNFQLESLIRMGQNPFYLVRVMGWY